MAKKITVSPSYHFRQERDEKAGEFVTPPDILFMPLTELWGKQMLTWDDSVPKTVHAVCAWTLKQKLPPPVCVEFEKPQTIGKIGQYEEGEEWHDLGYDHHTDDDGHQRHMEEPAKAYARTTARVMLAGETAARHLRVTFVWIYSTYTDLNGRFCVNLPETHGGRWVVKEKEE